MSFSDARNEQDAHLYRLHQARRLWEGEPARARLKIAAAARAADMLAAGAIGEEVERARERAALHLTALAAAWESMERDCAESTHATSLGPLLAWIGCDRRTYEDAVNVTLTLLGKW
jgi:hypothetical protein